MKEVWSEVEGFPNYAVSNYGYVVNLTVNRMIKGKPNQRGYLKVRLYGEDGSRDFYVHQLVAKAFFGDFRYGIQVKHVNGDRNDNAVTNLQLRAGTRDDGSEFDPLTPSGRAPWGKRIRVVETGEVFRSVRECARYLEADYTSIYKVLRGERKRHAGYTFEYYEE
jgi:hypothetical protein